MNRILCVVTSALLIAVGAGTALAQQGNDDKERRQPPRRAMRQDDAPKVGEKAPLFTLKSLDGKSETSLASFRDQRPVILMFGSYT